MTGRERRTVFGVALLGTAAAMATVYYLSLVPATHADHDHGVLNLDAGGRIPVETRGGVTRNLVGKPGRVLVVHFFDPRIGDAAADELRSLFRFQELVKTQPGTPPDFVLIARSPDFATLDSWLAERRLVPPSPDTLVVDPHGEATERLNCKRPLETMFFNAEGKLSSQTRGPLDWSTEVAGHIAKAREGGTIE